MRRLDASTAFGPLWHDTCWVQFLTVSDGDARNINEFGWQADEAMPEADAQMDVPDEDMEDAMPCGTTAAASSAAGPSSCDAW